MFIAQTVFLKKCFPTDFENNYQTTKMLKILLSMHRGKDRISHDNIETKIIWALL